MPESTLLIVPDVKSWPVSVGQEKRCDGGPARSQGAAQGSAQGSAVGGNPADGGWPDSRCAPAWGLLWPRLIFQPIQLRRFRTGAAAARGRHRAGQGGIDPAAVGRRQRRRRGAIDEECLRDGAGGIPESQYPASDQG